MAERNDLFLNSFYDRGNDELYIVMKDVETGKKKITKQRKPTIEAFHVKDLSKTPDTFLEFEYLHNLKPVKLNYKWREYDIARLIGYGGYADDVRNRHIKRSDIYLDKRFFGADLDIRDSLIMKYLDTFKKVDDNGTVVKDKEGHIVYDDVPPIKNIHNGYLDIEADIKVTQGKKFKPRRFKNRPEGTARKHYSFDRATKEWVEDPKITERREQPVNAITYIDDKAMVCYSFALRNKDYKKQKEIEENIQEFIQEVKDQLNEELYEIEKTASSKEKKKVEKMRKIFDQLRYVVKFYDKEEDLLTTCYQLIMRHKKPDFLNIFNAEYDISQTQLRADKLKIPQTDLFTDPEVGNFINFDYEDDSFSPAKKRVNFDCASEVKILDLRQVYYSLRAQKQFPTNNLEDTARRETKFGKLSYTHICDNFADFCYEDFRTFLKYNIRDTIVMMLMNEVTNDITSLVSKRFVLRTEYDRVFSAMLSVSNVFFHVSKRYGMVLGNDVNKYLLGLSDDTKQYIKEADERMDNIMEALLSEDGIDGGLCTDPNKFFERGLVLYHNYDNYKVFGSVVDIDAKSMYPSNIILASISRSTLIGQIIGLGDIQELTEDIELRERILKAREAIGYDVATSLISRDPIAIGASLFTLPNQEELFVELFKDVKKDMSDREMPKGVTLIPNGSPAQAIHKILSKLDNIKLNEKDQQAGQYKSAHNYIVHSDSTKNVMRYNGSAFKYKLLNSDISEHFDLKGLDFLYLVTGDKLTAQQVMDNPVNHKQDRNIVFDNEPYERFVQPKDDVMFVRTPETKSYNLTDKMDEIKNNTRTITRLNLDGVAVDMGSRITPIMNGATSLGAYVTPTEDENVFDVVLKQTVPVKAGKTFKDMMEITQHMKVINYEINEERISA